MASKQPSPQATCEIHTDTKAEAICLKHHELLCIPCIVDKAKSGDCNITVIQNIQNEREHCILKHVCAKQTVKRLGENKSIQLSQAQELKEKLLADIGDLHKEFSSRLDKMVETCEKCVRENESIIEEEIAAEYKFLDDEETQLNSNLEKLKDEDANLNECFAKLRTIQEDLLHASNESLSEVEASFIPDEALRECFKNESLGQVLLIRQQQYEYVGDPDGPSNVLAELKKPDEAECTESDFYSEVNMPQDNSAEGKEQKTEMRKTPKENEGKEIFNQDNSAEDKEQKAEMRKTPKENEGKEISNRDNSAEDKEQKAEMRKTPLESKRKGIFSFFKRKSKGDFDIASATKLSTIRPVSAPANVGLTEYAEVTNPQSKSFKLRNIVNKKMKIPDLEMKFTKLVHLGEGCIGLLADSTVLVTQFPNGPTLRKLFSKPVSSIVSTGCREIAVLIGEQIHAFGIQSRQLILLRSYDVQETITDVSGFDFDVKTSRYAVSTYSKVLILDKKGKLINTCKISHTAVDASDFRSVYDFITDHVIYLNVNLRTFKSLKCNKGNAEVVWRKKCNDENFVPKDICLYKDVFCVASPCSLALFLKADGTPDAKHDTYDILSDCLAVCVTDDIAMWTSDGDDNNLSTYIGFVALTHSATNPM